MNPPYALTGDKKLGEMIYVNLFGIELIQPNL